jgi:hypothetical protein
MTRSLTALTSGLILALAAGGCETNDGPDRSVRTTDRTNEVYGYQSPPNADAPRGATTPQRQTQSNNASAVIANWPEVSKKAAHAMIQKYGQPQGVTSTMLMWKDNGPWMKTIVMRDPIKHIFPMDHEDCLEQFINYRVPPDKFDELAEYDGSVICERTAGWLSARCDKEEANFLAINLAHMIITGKMSVDEARQEYARNVNAMMKGEKPELMQRLQFEPQTGGTGDPDKPLSPPTRTSSR